MSRQGTAFRMQTVYGSFIVLLLTLLYTPTASAAVGTVLRTINLPQAAKCDEGFHSPALFTEFGANFFSGAEIGEFRTTKGIAAAAVQGSKVGFPQHPVLLVTSCVSTQLSKASSLYFLDPTAPAATAVVKTINTNTATGLFAPPLGWGALVYRPDRGDLLGCGNGGNPAKHPIYSIDISALNAIPDGRVTFLFEARPNGSTDLCDGLAWDPSNKTIYHGADVATVAGISHFSESGAVLEPAFDTPLLVSETCEGAACLTVQSALNRCPKSGLALVGGALFVACDGQLQVQQIDKTTKARIRAFVTPAGTRTEDLECDPITFAAQGKDAIWTRDIYPVRYTTDPDGAGPIQIGEPILTLDANGNVTATGDQQLFAMELPAGTCGLPAGPTVLHPAACLVYENGVWRQDPDNKIDTDGDGLLDCWEKKGAESPWAQAGVSPGDGLPATLPGIDFDGDGRRDLVLCIDANEDGVFDEATECAEKNVKDIFVEFDTMQNHPANVAALNSVITAFANQGIRLHVQVDDDDIPHATNTAMPPCTPIPLSGSTDADFDTLKGNWFGTASERSMTPDAQQKNTLFAKRMAFRYGIGVHDLTLEPGKTSPSGCAEVVGNDFIVSLGSFPTGTTTTHKNGTQDEWEGTFMHELGHTLGLRHGGGDNINCKPNYLSVMSYSRQFKNIITDRPLDYSGFALPTLNEALLIESVGIIAGLPSPLPLPAGAKTTYAPSPSSTTARIASATGKISWDGDRKDDETVANIDINKIGSGTGCDGVGTVLVGFDDWENLVFNFRASFDFADGVHGTAEEVVDIRPEEKQAQSEAVDADGDGVEDVKACGLGACVIDITPGDPKNLVPLVNNNGVPTASVSVAIMSTSTFDASTINADTLTLNAVGVSRSAGGKAACSLRDVNGDKRRDLVCQFVLTGVSPGDEIAVLEGRTVTATTFRGQDLMHIVQQPVVATP